MRFDRTMLSSKLARRLFAIFVLCSLVPIVVLTYVSYRQTSSTLSEQAYEQLMEANRSVGLSIFERLLLAELELSARVQTGIGLGTDGGASLLRRIEHLHSTNSTEHDELGASVLSDVPLKARERTHLEVGKTLLRYVPATATSSDTAGLELIRKTPAGDYVAGGVDLGYLWAEGLLGSAVADAELIVLAPSGDLLFSSLEGAPGELLAPVHERTAIAATYDVEIRGVQHLASYRQVPLRFWFGAPDLVLVLAQPQTTVLATPAAFQRNLFFVGLMTLWVVLLMSISQIRRTLDPLEKLRDATRRIGEGELGASVSIRSKDEFAELGDSFNDMSKRLERQFNTLHTRSEIDRTILASLDLEAIAGSVVAFSCENLNARAASLTVADPRTAAGWHTFIGRVHDDGLRRRRAPSSAPDATAFTSGQEYLRREPGTGSHGLEELDGLHLVQLPVRVTGSLRGLLTVGCERREELGDEQIASLQQLASQLAVALANAGLVNDLTAMQEGALLALARTVDTKSGWTGGHSERVTDMALQIGRELGLDAEHLKLLHRGGLLHDIGKIGVPNSILDKPGKLTDEEFDIVKQHPSIGVRILEPVAAYRDVLDIVEQHHERYDGKGYPHGLAGKEIAFDARIFAVADVFDACRSDRPYREGMPLQRVVGIIREGSGTHFDPQIVDAFLRVIDRQQDEQGLAAAS